MLFHCHVGRRGLVSGPLALLLLAGSSALAQQGQDAAAQTTCADCHQEQTDLFSLSVHGRLAPFELKGHAGGCEACHGSGRAHMDSGEAKDIIGFKNTPVAQVEKMCLACHAGGVGHNWKLGEHSRNGVTCIQCHKIHQSRTPLPVARGFTERPLTAALKPAGPPPRASLSKPDPALCQECHKSVSARMMLPSRHPVREGKMNCGSCHNVHGSEVAGLNTSERPNDLCLGCHTSKQGPFVFDHQPVSESCSTCHTAHGSVNNNLLKQNEPFLCLQCHEAHFHVGRSGATTAVQLPTGGSKNPWGEDGWRRAFGTKCTQCHAAVHGSDLPGQSVTGRGKSLTR